MLKQSMLNRKLNQKSLYRLVSLTLVGSLALTGCDQKNNTMADGRNVFTAESVADPAAEQARAIEQKNVDTNNKIAEKKTPDATELAKLETDLERAKIQADVDKHGSDNKAKVGLEEAANAATANLRGQQEAAGQAKAEQTRANAEMMKAYGSIATGLGGLGVRMSEAMNESAALEEEKAQNDEVNRRERAKAAAEAEYYRTRGKNEGMVSEARAKAEADRAAAELLDARRKSDEELSPGQRDSKNSAIARLSSAQRGYDTLATKEEARLQALSGIADSNTDWNQKSQNVQRAKDQILAATSTITRDEARTLAINETANARAKMLRAKATSLAQIVADAQNARAADIPDIVSLAKRVHDNAVLDGVREVGGGGDLFPSVNSTDPGQTDEAETSGALAGGDARQPDSDPNQKARDKLNGTLKDRTENTDSVEGVNLRAVVGSDKGATTFKNDKLVAYATAVYEVKDGDLIPQNGYGNLTQDQKAALNDIGVRTDVTSGDLIAPITAPNSNVVKTAVVDSDAAVKAATGSGFEYNSTATCAQNALNCGLALANDPEYTNIRYATVVVGNDGVAVGHAVILADVNDLETGKTKTIVVDPKGTIFEIGKNVEINAAEQAIPVEKGGLAATIKLADTALTVETPITETESKDVRDASAESDSGSTPDATAAASSSADAATAAADTSTGVGKPADDIVTEVMGSGEKTAGGQIVSSEGDAPGVASDPAAPQAQARQTASLEGSVVDKTFVSPVLPEESAQSTPLDKPDDKPAAPLGSPTPGPEVPSHGGTNNFEKQDAAANDQNFVTNPKAFNPLDNLGGSSTSETPSTDNKSLPKIDMNSLAAFNPNNPTPPPLPRLTVFACEGISAACSVEEIRDGSLNKALVQSGEMLEQLATLVADQNTAKDRGEIEKVIRLESEIQTKQEEIANLRDQISSTWSQVSGLVDNSYQGMTYANSANLINGALNKITDTHNAIIAGESFDSETIANLKSSDNYSSFAANYSSFMTEAPLSPGAGSILADVSGDYFQNPVRIAQNGSNSSFSSTPPRSRNDDPTANLRDP